MAAESLPTGFGIYSHDPFELELFGAALGHQNFEIISGLLIFPLALGLIAKRQLFVAVAALLAVCVTVSVNHAKFVLAGFEQVSMPFPWDFFVQWLLLSLPAAFAGYLAGRFFEGQEFVR